MAPWFSPTSYPAVELAYDQIWDRNRSRLHAQFWNQPCQLAGGSFSAA